MADKIVHMLLTHSVDKWSLKPFLKIIWQIVFSKDGCDNISQFIYSATAWHTAPPSREGSVSLTTLNRGWPSNCTDQWIMAENSASSRQFLLPAFWKLVIRKKVWLSWDHHMQRLCRMRQRRKDGLWEREVPSGAKSRDAGLKKLLSYEKEVSIQLNLSLNSWPTKS